MTANALVSVPQAHADVAHIILLKTEKHPSCWIQNHSRYSCTLTTSSMHFYTSHWNNQPIPVNLFYLFGITMNHDEEKIWDRHIKNPSKKMMILSVYIRFLYQKRETTELFTLK